MTALHARRRGARKRTSGPLVSDTFTRASAPTLGSAETGQPWSTTSGTGWEVVDGVAHPFSGSNDHHLAWVDAGAADLEVAVTITGPTSNLSQSGEGGLVWRVIPGPPLSYFLYIPSNGSYWRVVNGNFTNIGSTNGFAAPYRYKVRVVGSTHTIYRNGVQLVQFTDSANAAGTRVGLRTYSNNYQGRFDDLVVTVPS